MSWIDNLTKLGWTVTSWAVYRKFNDVEVRFYRAGDSITGNGGIIDNLEDLPSAAIEKIRLRIEDCKNELDFYTKRINELESAMKLAEEELKPKDLGEILIEKGWVKYSCDGEYIMCGKKVSTYKDVANSVVKFLDEIAKPFREVLNESSR